MLINTPILISNYYNFSFKYKHRSFIHEKNVEISALWLIGFYILHTKKKKKKKKKIILFFIFPLIWHLRRVTCVGTCTCGEICIIPKLCFSCFFFFFLSAYSWIDYKFCNCRCKIYLMLFEILLSDGIAILHTICRHSYDVNVRELYVNLLLNASWILNVMWSSKMSRNSQIMTLRYSQLKG